MELEIAQKEALRLMREHGLHGWGFRFDDGVRSFGTCRYRDKTITLSRRITQLNEAHHVTDIILHEIAHALAGHAAGHGPVWRATAVRIGCSAARCYESERSEGDGRVKVPNKVVKVRF
jgi:SprT protein